MNHRVFTALVVLTFEAHAATVQFVGNEKLPTASLREKVAGQIAQIESTGVTPARADDLSYFTGLTYLDNGFTEATVTPQITADTLTLDITEGPRTQLTTTTFLGATAYDEKKLADFLLGPTRENVTGDDLPYVPDKLAEGVDRLRDLYLSDGYLDVEITTPTVALSNDRTDASATVTISEGPPYTFGPIAIVGSSAVPIATLRESLADLTTQPYSSNRLRLIEERVAYEFQKAGHYQAKATARRGPAISIRAKSRQPILAEEVPVTIQVTPGPPFRFGTVTADHPPGDPSLPPRFVRRRFASLTDRPYDPAALNTRFQRQLGTGLYDQLRLRQLPDPTTNEVDLAIEYEPAPSREVGFSLGYGTFEGAGGGIRFVERNLFGTGRSFTASIDATQRTFGADLTLEDPWFLDRDDLALTFRATVLNRRLEGYTKSELALRPELTWTLTPRLTASVFLLAKGVSVEAEGISDNLIGRTPYLANSIGLTSVYDTRDNPLNPDQGFVLGTTADFATRALGSEVSFARFAARAAYYLPLGNTLLAFGARGGIMIPTEGNSSVPIDERFFNGGASSVRSFADRELGPHNNGYPTGGQTYTVFNLEYVVPIVDSLKAAVFVDAGSVGQTSSEFGILRTGIGAGLRYDLPIGPIRLDAALNPAPRSGEAIGAIHFTVGLAF